MANEEIPQPVNPPQLVITLNPNGLGVHVVGPIDNPILCYGMLTRAHDAIKDYTEQRARPRVIPAATMPAPPLRQ